MISLFDIRRREEKVTERERESDDRKKIYEIEEIHTYRYTLFWVATVAFIIIIFGLFIGVIASKQSKYMEPDSNEK